MLFVLTYKCAQAHLSVCRPGILEVWLLWQMWTLHALTHILKLQQSVYMEGAYNFDQTKTDNQNLNILLGICNCLNVFFLTLTLLLDESGWSEYFLRWDFILKWLYHMFKFWFEQGEVEEEVYLDNILCDTVGHGQPCFIWSISYCHLVGNESFHFVVYLPDPVLVLIFAALSWDGCRHML